MRERHGGKGKKLFGSRLHLGREAAGRADKKGQLLPLIAHGGDFLCKRFGRTALPLYRERDDVPPCGAQNVGSFLGERGAFGKFADVERVARSGSSRMSSAQKRDRRLLYSATASRQ